MDEKMDAVREAVSREINSSERLRELGFTQNEFGEWRAANCTVAIYSSCGEYEIDIKLPNGGAVGFDVRTFAGRTADESAAARRWLEYNTSLKGGDDEPWL